MTPMLLDSVPAPKLPAAIAAGWWRAPARYNQRPPPGQVMVVRPADPTWHHDELMAVFAALRDAVRAAS